MKRSTVVFFFGLIIVVALIARCNSRSRLAEERERAALPASPLLPSAGPSATAITNASALPTAQPTASAAVDMPKVAAGVQRSVVLISVFEPSGKLLRSGTGVFVSNDGRVLTTRSLMEGASHAIAKTPDNRIYNVSGILADVAADDLAVLNTELKDPVPSIMPNTVSAVEKGAQIAIVQSPLGRSKVSVLEGTVLKVHKAARGEWLELSIPVSSDGMGAPVIDARGDVIGLVTRGPGDPAVVVRTSASLNAALTRAPTEGKGKFFVEESPLSPAEGPLRKMPLAPNPQSQQSRLIYSPPPAYPSAARNSGPPRGSGRFRLTFNVDGRVTNITILRSTQNAALDQAAIDALRRWKATPGEEWTLNVPITFQ